MTPHLDQIRGDLMAGDMHAVFRDALEAWGLWNDDEPEPKIDLGEQQITISMAFRLLSGYNDLMPNHLADEVWDLIDDEKQEIEPTYSAAAAYFERQIAEQLSHSG